MIPPDSWVVAFLELLAGQAVVECDGMRPIAALPGFPPQSNKPRTMETMRDDPDGPGG